MSVVTVLSVALSGYLGYQNMKLKNQAIKPTPSISPTPSPVSNISNSDSSTVWKSEQWSTEGNSEEFPIPGVTYNIEHPEEWIFSNKITKVNKLDCFDISMTDKENTVSIRIYQICTGWGAVDDKTELPSDYELVNKKQGMLNGQSDFRYLIRSENSPGTITYIEGQGTEDNISTAFFTNAVMITGEEKERNTHSYFSPVKISAIYENGSNRKSEYLEILDNVVSSFVITKVNSQE